MMRYCSVLFFIMICTACLRAQVYQRVLLQNPTPAQLELLSQVDDDHARAFRGNDVEAILPQSAAQMLHDAGCSITVLTPDMTAFYRLRAQKDLQQMRALSPQIFSKPSASSVNFTLGSVAGFLSPQEILEQYARMVGLYPGLVAAPQQIGTTTQGRAIYAIRISARPETDNTVPEVLFTAMHHAREPGSMMSLIYTMWRVLEGYGTDPEATYLLNNRALYFIPVVNPDGYARNAKDNPDGGGLWRKNMRDNQDSSLGVDLNRNYGPVDNWDNPSGGSSTDTHSDTYRGPAMFSEPETMAVRDFCNAHRFSIALNRHTFSNLLINPYNWKTRFPADTAYYRLATRVLASAVGYAPGTDAETVGYLARGNSDEWMHRYATPNGTVISWTPEAGNDQDGFWPVPSRITPIAENDHRLNLLAAWAAGAAPRVTSAERIDLPGARPGLRVVLANVGRVAMDTGASLRITPGDTTLYRIPALNSTGSVLLDIPLPPRITNNATARPELALMLNYRGVDLACPVRLPVHPQTVLFQDNFDGALDKWSPGQWGTEPVAGHGFVLSDSPLMNYTESGTPNVIKIAQPVALSGQAFTSAELTFDASCVVQARDHYVKVEAQRTASGLWETLECGSFQVPNDSATTTRTRLRGNLQSWTRYSINLDKYLGSNIFLRFYLVARKSQFGFTFNGMLIDSVRVLGSLMPSTGLHGDAGAGRLAAWPNPFRDRLHLSGTGYWLQSGTQVLLSDMLGRVVARTCVEGGQDVTFNTGNLPDGCYVVRVPDKDGAIRAIPVVLQR